MKQEILQKLRTIIKDNIRISDTGTDKLAHSQDKSFHKASQPDLVIWPKTAEEISAIMKLANRYRIPITAWGGGSSLEGNPIPTHGGIVLDMTLMNKIVKIYEKDFAVTVQPGIVGDDLNKQLKKYKLFFPVAPGSSYIATIGGMIANNAGGMYAVKYGVVGDWVLELEVVLANGDIIRTGRRSFKTVSGYDIKSLLIGSEGTLGIITEATVKLTPLPQKRVAFLVSFPTVTKAVQTSIALLKSGLQPAAIEFMDTAFIAFINKDSPARFKESPTLIIELHDSPEIIAIKKEKIMTLCKKSLCNSFREFITLSSYTTLWNYRKSHRNTIRKHLPHMGVLSAEVGLPISHIPAFLKKSDELAKKYAIQKIMFGHIADGNFHGWALYEKDNKKSWEQVAVFNEELIIFALGAGGTTTGEHGLGIGKRKFLPREHPTSYPWMKDIKRLFDPHTILNPGKIFPDEL